MLCRNLQMLLSEYKVDTKDIKSKVELRCAILKRLHQKILRMKIKFYEDFSWESAKYA
jgi:hypothetical protein